MTILVVDTGSFMIPDFIIKLNESGYKYRSIRYLFDRENIDSKYNNEEFESLLNSELEKGYDCVFTTNFYPVIARVCHEREIKYIAWSYDSPMNLTGIDEMAHPTNYLFLFDGSDVEKYQKAGLEHVYHLPLAVNCDRLDKVRSDDKYSTDVSFLGQLYSSTLPVLKKIMAPYQQEFVDQLVQTQLKIYGNWFVEDMLTDKILEDMNNHFRSLSPDAIQLTREELAYSVAQQITYYERVSLLRLIRSRGCSVDLYTKSASESDLLLLKDIRVHGELSYGIDMPILFKSSKINLNVTLKILKSGIPLRALDIMGCGGFLLTNFQQEISEYFTDGKDVVMYKSLEEAVDKACYYLDHDNERKIIAQNGYKKVREKFRYEDRIREMFVIAGVER
jgi:spore maturation protein CgeB